MQKRKYIKIASAILICVGGIALLISQIKFAKDRDRNISNCVLTPDLRNHITEISNTSDTPEKIINECSDQVCEKLSFNAKNNIQNGKANCVGYAQLTSAVINYAFQVKKLPYKAKPVVGKVYLFGIDLNNISQTILPQKHRPFSKTMIL